MAVFFFMSTALSATPVAPSLSSGLEFGRANWTAADHAAARASCRFVAGGRAYDLRALAGLTVVAELALGMESVGDKLPRCRSRAARARRSPPPSRTRSAASAPRTSSGARARAPRPPRRRRRRAPSRSAPSAAGRASARRRRARRPSRGTGGGPSACAGCGRGAPPPVRPENLRKRVDAPCCASFGEELAKLKTRARLLL